MASFQNLHFPRFIAALGVVLFHYGSYSFGEEFPFTLPFMGIGGLGVSFFFFLSGVVMVTAYPSPLDSPLQKKKFFSARFARIYPLAALTAALTLLLAFLNHSFPLKSDILLQFLLVQAWIPGKNLVVNAPSWSVSVELFFYLLFPLLQKFCLRLNNSKLILFSLSVWAITLANHHYNVFYLNPLGDNTLGEYLLRFPPFHLNLFLGGMTLGILVARGFKLSPNQGLLSLLSGSFLFIYLTVYCRPLSPYLAVATLMPVYVIIVSGLLFLPDFLTKLIASKPSILLGDASYAVYLLQLPLWNFFMQYALPNGFDPGDVPVFVGYLLILLFLSILSYKYFEKPLRQSIRERLIR